MPSAAAPLPVGAALGPIRDAVVLRTAPAMRVARTRARTRTLSTPDGYQLEVEVSPSYAADGELTFAKAGVAAPEAAAV